MLGSNPVISINMAAESQLKHLSPDWVCYESMNSSFVELINSKVILFLIQMTFQLAKSPDKSLSVC